MPDILASKYTPNIKIAEPPLPVVSSTAPSRKSLPTPAHLNLLLVAVISYAVVGYILWKVPPDTIAHLVLPNSYIPLLVSSFVANFCLLSFVFKNSRRGFILATVFLILLFLRLQQVLTI